MQRQSSCRTLLLKENVIYVPLVALGTLGEIDVTIKIPIAVAENSTVKMTCDYDLRSKPLYAVKWYKSQNEFYRFIPKEIPSKSVFPPLAAKVDVSIENNNNNNKRYEKYFDLFFVLVFSYKERCENRSLEKLLYSEININSSLVLIFKYNYQTV